mgnify:CR=1 FL=1
MRIYWWMSFIGLCGIFACCISGFVTSHYFHKKVSAIKCMYERIYYDSEYGELNTKGWKGLKERNEIIQNFHNFINNEYEFKFSFDKNSWEKGNSSIYLDKNVYYFKNFSEEIRNIIRECEGRVLRKYDDSGELVCDLNNYDKSDSILKKYINEATRISKIYSDEVINIKKFIKSKSKTGYNIEINKANEIFESISEDLDNYKNNFLDNNVDYYIKISHICGYILVIIFYCFVLVTVLFCCFLLWAYSFFKEQKLLILLMHISWNILRFFSMSFFLFGAAFGILYLFSRDLINYNQFLFSNSNLGQNETTYLLPNESAKDFLRYCKNEENSNYINNFDLEITKLIGSLYYNLKEGDEIKDNYNFTNMNFSVNCYAIINSGIRNMQEFDTTDGWVDIVNISFVNAGNALRNMINTLYDVLHQKAQIANSIRKLATKQDIVKHIEDLENDIKSLNCGFIKNELEMIYDSLYELSIESRISCTLCCFIGFFAEITIGFYLLVIYHYNKNEFKEGNEPRSRNIDNKSEKSERSSDMESQNEFMKKNKPSNLKQNNKKLDIEFSIN